MLMSHEHKDQKMFLIFFFIYINLKLFTMNDKHKKPIFTMLISYEHNDQKMLLNFFLHIIQLETVKNE